MNILDQNQALIMQYFKAFGERNFTAIELLLAEDVVWHVPGSEKVVTAGLGVGKDYVKSWIQKFEDNFVTRELSVDTLIPHGDEVLVSGFFSHQVVKTGRIFSGDFVLKFQVKDGKITKYQIFEDSYQIDKAFDPFGSITQNNVVINSTSYAYTDVGEGAPIVFAHGLFVDRSMFQNQVTALCEEYRCLNFDLPAHGFTNHKCQGWTLDDLADDLAVFIQESRLGKVTFVGQSQGGMIGIRLAAKYPELVKNLVLIGTSAHAEAVDRIPFWTAMRETLATGTYEERRALCSSLQKSTKSELWRLDNPELALIQRTQMLDLDSAGMRLAIDAAVLKRQDCSDLLPLINANTLILCGREDQATPVIQSLAMKEQIPGSTLHIIDEAHHHVPIEKPEIVLALLQSFLRAS